MELIEIRKKLKKVQDKDRYEHTKGVMYTAGCLAMAYGSDMQKAMLAGRLFIAEGSGNIDGHGVIP